jgi:hypothetical protein
MKEEFDILFAEHQKLLGELHAMRNVKRSWVGLTDDEVSNIIDDVIGFNSCWGPETDFARAIEFCLREKNS